MLNCHLIKRVAEVTMHFFCPNKLLASWHLAENDAITVLQIKQNICIHRSDQQTSKSYRQFKNYGRNLYLLSYYLDVELSYL